MVDWADLAVRALFGGFIVSAFALIGDVLKPKSFAGLFGAAPSVAIASIVLTLRSHPTHYVMLEARSMAAGALAFAIYAYVTCRILLGGEHPVRRVAILALGIWIILAFVLWKGVLAHFS